MKADRFSRRQFRRLGGEQKQALDRLRWHSPGPAERARLKLVLGWRRTRDETIALARELDAEGLLASVIADRLGVGDRYLRRLLAEPAQNGARPSERRPANPLPERAEVALTCETRPDGRTRPPLDGFGSFAELDAWLEERGR